MRNQKPSHRRRGSNRMLKAFLGLLFLVLLIPLVTLLINLFVCITTVGNISTEDELLDTNCDFIVVLGAGIEEDGSPSPILKERLDKAISLYEDGIAEDIIVSGGNDAAQSEISAMRNYLTDNDVPRNAILSDTQGDNTFASIRDLRDIYGAHSVVLVSQRFHLYRAIYIAEKMDIETYGCPASIYRITDSDLLTREYFARLKDFSQFFADKLPEPLVSAVVRLYHNVIPQ